MIRRIEALERAAREKDVSAKPSEPSTNETSAQSTPEERLREEETLRALERTLVREGALVLPSGSFELEPDFGYSYRGRQGVRIATIQGQTVAAGFDERRDRLQAGLTFRLGLLANLQFDAHVPFEWERADQVVGGVETTTTDSGIGDVAMSLTKELWRERPGRPGVLASLTASVPARDSEPEPAENTGLLTPTGFKALQGALTGIARDDPLVFYGTLSYATIFSDKNRNVRVAPGDSIGVTLGTALAVSPRTSLRFATDLAFAQETSVNGIDVPGSDGLSGVFEMGLAMVLSPRALFDVAAGFGFTDDAPDFRLRISLPIRF